MQTVVVLAVQPGRGEAWRRFVQELAAERCAELEAWQRRAGIAVRSARLIQMRGRDFAVISMDLRNRDGALDDLAASSRPFERWLKAQLLELHGVDVGSLAAELPVEEAWGIAPDTASRDEGASTLEGGADRRDER